MNRLRKLRAQSPRPSSTAPAALSRSQRDDVTPRPESERIEFLLRRDGPTATRTWVERTLTMYRKELSHPSSYACDATYRPRFEKAVREFEDWLAVITPQRPSQTENAAQPMCSRRIAK